MHAACRAMVATTRRSVISAPPGGFGGQAPAHELRRSAGLGGIEGAEPLASPFVGTKGMLA